MGLAERKIRTQSKLSEAEFELLRHLWQTSAPIAQITEQWEQLCVLMGDRDDAILLVQKSITTLEAQPWVWASLRAAGVPCPLAASLQRILKMATTLGSVLPPGFSVAPLLSPTVEQSDGHVKASLLQVRGFLADCP